MYIMFLNQMVFVIADKQVLLIQNSFVKNIHIKILIINNRFNKKINNFLI